jgi:hypothetical protein
MPVLIIKTRNSCLRADSHGANKSLKTVGISHAQEAALPACSCRRLAPPLAVIKIKKYGALNDHKE